MRWTVLLTMLVMSAAAARADDAVVDASKLPGVMCGYQGWFRCPGDGADVGWFHYGFRSSDVRACGIEMWPDVSELTPEERFATPLRHADGRTAEVFSSVNPRTVRRHFEWMKQYGIDGVFVQRFATILRDERHRRGADTVLTACRDSAKETGRAWVVMYDLSGTPGNMKPIMDDWDALAARLGVAGDDRYVKIGGKPLVAVWGLGFNDRAPMLDEWRDLLEHFRGRGCAIMLGVPFYWRTMKNDAISDPRLHELIGGYADVLSPWSVGRHGTILDVERHAEQVWRGDAEWCAARKITYLPVAFPGFSWHNLQKSRGKDAPFDQIPRLGGRFLWSQAAAAKGIGLASLYIAMFDEMDEGTAIFKCTAEAPAGDLPFIREQGVPSDQYLWLTGQIGRMMRGEIPATPRPPSRDR